MFRWKFLQDAASRLRPLARRYAKIVFDDQGCPVPLNCEFGNKRPKTAILIISNGEPESPDEAEEYMKRVWRDKHDLKTPTRAMFGTDVQLLKQMYEAIGGHSPLKRYTCANAKRVADRMNVEQPGTAPHKGYVGFTFSNPTIKNAVDEIFNDNPKNIVVLSHYPHYSCAQAGLAFEELAKVLEAKLAEPGPKRDFRWTFIENYAVNSMYIQIMIQMLTSQMFCIPKKIRDKTVLIFACSTVPLENVLNGDFYCYEIGATITEIMFALNYDHHFGLGWFTPQTEERWPSPDLESIIRGFQKDGAPAFMVCPVCVPVDNVKTQYLLDIQLLGRLKQEWGDSVVIRRADAPNVSERFVDALMNVIVRAMGEPYGVPERFLNVCHHCPTVERCKKMKRVYCQLTNPRH